MTKVSTLHKKWMKYPAFRKEYEALEEEFARIAALATPLNIHRPPIVAAEPLIKRGFRPVVDATAG